MSSNEMNEGEGARPNLMIRGIEVMFPFKPYPAQQATMDKILRCAQHAENALVESPTGSGKSLSILASAISWLKVVHESHGERGLVNAFDDPEVALKPDLSGSNHQGTIIAGEEAIALEAEIESDDAASVESSECSSQEEFMAPKRRMPAGGLRKRRKRRGTGTTTASGTIKEADVNTLQSSGHGYSSSSHVHATSSLTQSQGPTQPEGGVETNRTPKRLPRVFIASRTHSQLNQLLQEYQRSNLPLVPYTYLASRDTYCIHSKVKHAKNKTEECTMLRKAKNRSCHYRGNSKALCDIIPPHGGPPRYVFQEVWSVARFVEVGKKRRSCPYFGSKARVENAQIVFCPYSYLIDPYIRRKMDIQLKGDVVLLDEAHNMEDVCREAASFTLEEQDLEKVVVELKGLLHVREDATKFRALMQVLLELLRWMQTQSCKGSKSAPSAGGGDSFGKSESTWPGVEGLSILENCGFSAHTMHVLWEQFSTVNRERNGEEVTMGGGDIEEGGGAEDEDEKSLSGFAVSFIESFFTVVDLFLSAEGGFIHDYVVVFRREPLVEYGGENRENLSATTSFGGGGYKHKWRSVFCLSCLHPAVAFQSLERSCRSVVLLSGTLSPLDSFQSELGVNFRWTLEAPHVIDTRSQCWVGVIHSVTAGVELNFSHRHSDKLSVQDSLGQAIMGVLEEVRGGVLVFFPSYSLLRRCISRWQLTGQMEQLQRNRMTLTEPQSGSSEHFAKMMDSYSREIREGSGSALLLAVFRGKVSEGMDLADDMCRAVCVVGVPFPFLGDATIKEKREYNDRMRVERACLSGSEWYTLQAFRAVNQAIGRAIRHVHDWGCVFFLDSRYAQRQSVQRLPKWMRQHVRQFPTLPLALQDCRQFYTGHTATSRPAPAALPFFNSNSNSDSAIQLQL
jgi:fanconi anemia group J protein